MIELINVLEQLALTIPGSKESINFINSQPFYLQCLMKAKQNKLIKKSLSTKESYADMTTVTVY